MTTSTSCTIEELIDQISKKRISLKKDRGFIYHGEDDGIHYLRYFLRCLGLGTSGSKDDLIKKIESVGIKQGNAIYDPSIVESNSVQLIEYPMYLLRTYLKEHRLSINGNKRELIERIDAYQKTRISISSDTFDGERNLVATAIYDCNQGNKPNEESIDAMEKHGYFYDSTYNAFYCCKTHEKLLGEKSWVESLWLMTYPKFSDSMEFISIA